MQKIKLIKQRKHPYLTDKNLVIFYLHSPTWGSYPGVNENKNKDQTMYRLYSYDILNKLRYQCHGKLCFLTVPIYQNKVSGLSFSKDKLSKTKRIILIRFFKFYYLTSQE